MLQSEYIAQFNKYCDQLIVSLESISNNPVGIIDILISQFMAVAEHTIKGKKFGEYRLKAVFERVISYFQSHDVVVTEDMKVIILKFIEI